MKGSPLCAPYRIGKGALRMKRALAFAASLLGAALLIFAGILAIVHEVGTDAELYHALQMRADCLESAGISEEDLIKLDKLLADALAGHSDALFSPMLMEVNGRLEAPFDERELLHMRDCVELFALARRVMITSAVAGILLLGCGFWRTEEKRRFRRAVWLGSLLAIVLPGALAAWAVLDFNAAFNFFHEMLFTNLLWQLNPTTDLLIRICPASMFMNMGVRIGVMSVIWTLVLPSVATALKKGRD